MGLGLVLVLSVMVGIGAAVACTGDVISRPAPCKGAGCTCEQDPSQPLCKGFDDRPEGGGVIVDSAAPEAGDATMPSDASDAGDAADAADAPADG